MPGSMKLALSVFAVFVLGTDTPRMSNPSIKVDPANPRQGEEVTITYSGKPGTILDLDWDPAAEPREVEIGPDGTAKVKVPRDATSLIVSDPIGGADDVAVIIAP